MSLKAGVVRTLGGSRWFKPPKSYPVNNGLTPESIELGLLGFGVITFGVDFIVESSVDFYSIRLQHQCLNKAVLEYLC